MRSPAPASPTSTCPSSAGLRGRQSKIEPQVNGFWDNASFHNYADYALSPVFAAGLARLRQLGHAQRCAIMCAEAVWWRCHRRIIADYLIAAGESVFHILGPHHTEPAKLTEGAQVRADGTVVYPGAPTLLVRGIVDRAAICAPAAISGAPRAAAICASSSAGRSAGRSS